MGIAEILALITGAMNVITTFKGSAAMAKTTGYVQEAVATIGALAPLVTQWGNGEEVTLEDTRAALAGMNGALSKLDEIIANKP